MLLNQEATRLAGTIGPAPQETVIVETRFGVYEFTPDNTIVMPQGLVGFAEHQLFGLANLPEPVPEDFKLLQSLGEPPISFIVMPVPPEHAPIEPADRDEALAALGGSAQESVFLFICTIRTRRGDPGIDLSANLRAPIVFDYASRRARQHVLSNHRYSTRQPLDPWHGCL